MLGAVVPPAESVEGGQAATPARVFISYSWDSPEHKGRVLGLAASLSANGLEVIFDGAVSATPRQGLQRWMAEAIAGADRVLMVFTPTYATRFREAQASGVGRGVAWEADAILQELYSTGNREKFVPVVFDAAHAPLVAEALANLGSLICQVVDGDAGFTRLFAALSGQELVSLPKALAVTRVEPAAAEPTFRVLDAGAAGSEDDPSWRPAEGAAVPGREGWVLRRLLGQGAFGEVWLGQQTRLGRELVFKFCLDAERAATLRREVKLNSVRLKLLRGREDLAPVVEYQLDRAPRWIATEYSPQGSLLDWATAQGGLSAVPVEIRLELLAAIADALAAAHGAKIIHRDLKPSNVLIRERVVEGHVRPRPVLTDFGLSVLSDPAVLASLDESIPPGMQADLSRNPFNRAGTVMYMAPELRAGGAASIRSDIYALGVLLYQMVVGDFFRPAEDWEADVTDELLREDIRGALRRDPEKRWADAREVSTRVRTLEARRVARQEMEERQRRQAEEVVARSKEEEARRIAEEQASLARYAEEVARAQTEMARLLAEINALHAERMSLVRNVRDAVQVQHGLSTTPIRGPIECHIARGGGDLALGDFVGLRTLPNARVGLFIGDVTGHGAAAGVAAAFLHGAIAAQLDAGQEPGEVALAANAMFEAGNQPWRFGTAWIGLLDPSSGLLRYVNAGHGLAYRLQAHGGSPIALDQEGGLPLGIDRDVTYSSGAVGFDPGDLIVLATDGVIEQRSDSTSSAMFGTSRLLELLSRLPREPKAVATAVLEAVTAHAGGRELADDCTVLAMRVPARTNADGGRVGDRGRVAD